MIDLAALKAELVADPSALGYAAPLASGGDNTLADLLNAPRAGITVYRGIIDGREIVSATTPAEFLALTTAQQSLYLAITGASGGVDTSNALVRSAFTTMFAAGTATRAALAALAIRSGSRAEQLWGAGTVVDYMTVAAARRA